MDDSAPNFIAPDLSIPRAIPQDVYRAPDGIETHRKYSEVAERLGRAITAVASRVRVNPSSRVAQWRNAVDRLAQADKRGVLQGIIRTLQNNRWDHAYRNSFVALVESRAFIEIVEQLEPHLSDRDLRELVSGHPNPSRDSHSARGRDKEFEWFIAAVFRRAGLEVALAEPDVLIKVRGEIRSIAAKRIGSRSKLDVNISRASAQIARAKYPGYVFLDLTKYIDPGLEYFEHWRHDGREVMSRLLAVAHSDAIRQRRNIHVQGTFLRAAFPLISPGFVYGTGEHWVGAGVIGGDGREHRELTHVLVAGARGI